MQHYAWQMGKDAVLELLCAQPNSTEDPNMRPTGERERPSSSSRTFCVLDEYGLLDDTYGGCWVEDEETGEGGFLE
eukprot:4668391-Prorocentrum_lima.AAC.1